MVTVGSVTGYILTSPSRGSYSLPIDDPLTLSGAIYTGKDFGFYKPTLVVANNPTVLPPGITADFDNITRAVRGAISGGAIQVYGGGSNYTGFTVPSGKASLW